MTLREEVTMLSEMPIKLETSGSMLVDFFCFRFLVDNIRKTLRSGVATPDNKEIFNFILGANRIHGPRLNLKPTSSPEVSVKITDESGNTKSSTRFSGSDAKDIIDTIAIKASIHKLIEFAKTYKEKYPEEVDAAIRYLRNLKK